MQRIGLVTAFASLAACDPSLGTDEAKLPATTLELGVVSGGFYEKHDQPLSSYGAQVMCELDQLGAHWLRIQADWQDTSPSTYQSIIHDAHARGIKVLAVVNDVYCGSEAPGAPDGFIARYVMRLDGLLAVPLAGVDAIEVINEPNTDCGTGWNVGPNAFAWLLRRVWEWKQTRPDLDAVAIVAGAPINTNVHQDWWQGLSRSGAWQNGVRPFDYAAVHPYNPAEYAAGIDVWKDRTISGLRDIANLYWGLTGVQTPLIATEFGWQGPTDDDIAVAMQAGVDAMRESGVVTAALWYDYRDDEEGTQLQSFGLRRRFDPAANAYPAKLPVWTRFAELAGGTGGDPEQCWPPPRHSVHRSFNPTLGDHFYTFDHSEAGMPGYTVEAYDYFSLRDRATADTSELWRCYSAAATDHFYTTSPSCEDMPDMVRENNLGYIATTQLAGTRPLFRLYAPGDHFYTVDPAEVSAATSHGYTNQGITGYVW